MKKTTLDTKALNRIEDKLYRLSVQASDLVDELSTAIHHVERNHKNIVAAHKAHRTMAKQSNREGARTAETARKPQSYGITIHP